VRALRAAQHEVLGEGTATKRPNEAA